MDNLPVWLKTSFDAICLQHRQQKLPHGMLIVGHKGDGSGLFMQHLVNFLLCQNPSSMACGHCKSCQLQQSGHHPDYLVLEPEGKSMTIKVDAIRGMNKKVAETAQQGGNKVVYIESAQKMNANAANALLKVLEEPTQNTFILLETDQLGQTLPTIRSRCRIVQLDKPSIEQSLDYLALNGSASDPHSALSVAFMRPLDALNIKKEQLDRWYEVENKFLSNQSFTELSQYIFATNIDDLYRQILVWVDSAVRLQQNAKIELAPVSEGLLKSLQSQNSVSLFRFRDYIVEKMTAMKRQSNLNAQLLAEDLASRWLEMRGIQ